MTAVQGRPASDIQIRAAGGSDSTACAALLAKLGYPSPPEHVARRLGVLAEDPANRVFVAEAEGSIIGLASAYVRPLIHHDAAFVRIACLIVDEGWRDQGVGKRLVETIEAWARAEGCDLAEVTSGIQRLDAHRFYEGLGYAEKRKRFVKTL
jgi:GNAT superfamily N-acetyltransferase